MSRITWRPAAFTPGAASASEASEVRAGSSGHTVA